MNSKAFTLIELLVVISILGLLATIILLGMEGSKYQAEQKRAMEFAHTARISLGFDFIGEWKFDDGEDPTRDSSGNNNHGDLLPGDSRPIYLDYGVFGKALEFNGANYVSIGSKLGISSASVFTYAAWIKPADTGKRMAIIGGRYGNRDSFVVEADGKIRLALDDTVFDSFGVINWNQWNYVIAAYNYNSQDVGNTTVALYINGDLDREGVPSWSQLPIDLWDNSKRWIGWENKRDYYFTGSIDEVRIYNQALSSTEIQQLYAAGITKHGIVLK